MVKDLKIEKKEVKKAMTRDLTQGSPMRVIVMFTLSMIATSMMSYVYGITDSIMVSWFVDTHAMGAISAITPAYSMMDGVMSATISGFAIYAGRVFGAGDRQRLRRLMANAVRISAIIVLPVSLLSVIFAGPFADLMNIPQSFRADAVAYFAIIMGASPISAVVWLCSGMFRALGDSKSALYRSAVSGALNVVFNFIFLAVIPMGVAGAALGTVCANAVSAGMCLGQLKYRMPLLHFGRADIKLSKPIVRILLSNGLPMGLLNSVVSIGSLVLQIAINGHSESVITGISIGGKLLSLMWIIIQNFESSMVYFGAQNLGAGKYERVRSGYRSTFLLTLVLSGICTAVCIFFGEYFYRLFLGWGSDPETLEILKYAKLYIFTQTVFFPFMVGLCIPRGTLKGIGNTVPAVLCGVIELIARIAVSAVSVFVPLPESVELGILFFAGPAAWVGATIFLLLLIPRSFGKMKTLHDKEEREKAELTNA